MTSTIELIKETFNPFDVDFFILNDDITIMVSIQSGFVTATYNFKQLEYYGIDDFNALLKSMYIDFSRRVITKLQYR